MLLLSMLMLLLVQQCDGKPLDVSARIAMLLSDNIPSSSKDKAEAIDTILQLLAEIDLPAICEAVMMEKPDEVTQMDNIIAAAAKEQGFDSMIPAQLQTTENNIIPAKFPIKGINALPADFPMKMANLQKTETEKSNPSKVIIKSVEAHRPNISLSAEARRLGSQRIPELDRPELVGFKLAPSEHYMQELEGQKERFVGVVAAGTAEAVQSMEEGVTFRTSPSTEATPEATSGTTSTVKSPVESKNNITSTTEQLATSTVKLSTTTETSTSSTEDESTTDSFTATSTTEYLVETTTSNEIIEDISGTTEAPIVKLAAVHVTQDTNNSTNDDELDLNESSGEIDETTIIPTASDSFVKNAMEKINEYINSLNITSRKESTTEKTTKTSTEPTKTTTNNTIIKDVDAPAGDAQNNTVPTVNTTAYTDENTKAGLEKNDKTNTINTTETQTTGVNSTFRLYQTANSQSSSTVESTTTEQGTDSVTSESTTTETDMIDSTTSDSISSDSIANASTTTSLPLSSISESTTASTSLAADSTTSDADNVNSTGYETYGSETVNITDAYQEAETTQAERDSTTLDYFWTPGKTISVSDAMYEYDDSTDDHPTTSFHVSTSSENAPEDVENVTETSNNTKNDTVELTTEFVPEVSTESATNAPNAPNEYDYIYNIVDTDQKQDNTYDRYDNTAYGGYDINNIDYPQAATEYVLDPLKTSPHLLHDIYNDDTYVGTKQDTYNLDTKQDTYNRATKQDTYSISTKQNPYKTGIKQNSYNLGTKQHEVHTYDHREAGVNMLASIDSPANTGAEEDFMLSAQPGYFNSLADQSSWGLNGQRLKHHTFPYDKSYDKLFTAHTQTKESSTHGLASAMGVQQKTVWEEPTLPQIFFQPNGYSCPGLFGYYADISDCQAFFICSWGVPYRFVCPRGTLWSSTKTVCDWSSNVNCRNKK